MTRHFSPLPWQGSKPEVAFISGGGSGIGREFAQRLAREGVSVVLFNRSDAAAVVAELEALRVNPAQRFASFRADVADAAAIAAAVGTAVAQVGVPDLAINSAGIQKAARFDAQPAGDFEQVIHINLVGSRHFAAAVLPHLATGARLVLVASLAGLLGNFAYAAYCASKWGVVGLAEVLRVELAPRGINVSVCCPGELPTPLVEKERLTLDPVAGKLKDVAGTEPLDTACDAMLRGMAKNRFMLIPGVRPRLTAWGVRHFPSLMRRITDLLVRHFLK